VLVLLCFRIFGNESAGEEEEDQARDQDPGKPSRGDQHNPTGGHGQRPGGKACSLFIFSSVSLEKNTNRAVNNSFLRVLVAL